VTFSKYLWDQGDSKKTEYIKKFYLPRNFLKELAKMFFFEIELARMAC